MPTPPLPEEAIARMRSLYEAGEISIAGIAAEANCSVASVRNYAARLRWVRHGVVASALPSRRNPPFAVGDPCPGLTGCPLRKELVNRLFGALRRRIERFESQEGEPDGRPDADAKLLGLFAQTLGKLDELTAREEPRAAPSEPDDLDAYRRELARILGGSAVDGA